MKRIFLYFSLIIASGLLLTNIYTSIVDATSWGSDIPNSIETARQYYKASNPGNFFRIFSPVNQLLGLICMIVFWKRSKQVRVLLIVAFVLYMIVESLTFMYFYPRNEIMFVDEMDLEKVKIAWSEWDTMNWMRTLIMAVGAACSGMALHRTYETKQISLMKQK